MIINMSVSSIKYILTTVISVISDHPYGRVLRLLPLKLRDWIIFPAVQSRRWVSFTVRQISGIIIHSLFCFYIVWVKIFIYRIIFIPMPKFHLGLYTILSLFLKNYEIYLKLYNKRK